MSGQPTVAAGRVFVSADNGYVYALDAATGRVRWKLVTILQAWRRADEPPPGLPPDIRDFDLAPWIARGQVRWCAPGSDRSRLATTGACPYVDLPGVRHAQLIPAATSVP